MCKLKDTSPGTGRSSANPPLDSPYIILSIYILSYNCPTNKGSTSNTQIQEYREKFSVLVITYSKEYEARYRKRLLGMSRELRSLIDHASSIVVDEFGRASLLNAKEKAFIILTKEIMKLSNRRMVYELPLFGIDLPISYKTVERLYSDPLVIMMLNNLFVETLRKKDVGKCDAVGDGTGYSLTVAKHYRSIREKIGESVKKECGTQLFFVPFLNSSSIFRDYHINSSSYVPSGNICLS